jgi:uncharacterized membrane protein
MNQQDLQDLQLGKWLGAAALGAIVMYMLDPERGAPRRARSGERLRQLGRQTGDALDKVVHELGSRMSEMQDGAGQAVSRAMAAGEAGSALAGSMQGAADAASAAAAPALHTTPAPNLAQQVAESRGYGGGNGQRAAGMTGQTHPQSWGGARRGAALAGGGALGMMGLLSPRSPLSLMLGLAGIALLARGASNRPLRSVLSRQAGGAPSVAEKSIRIDAAPEQVYDMFASYENFPRFMSNVIQVRDLGDGRSHWVVKGPAGSEFSWNAQLTDATRPHRLAWKSEPGAEVEQSGEILFEPVRAGTRVSVRIAYRPPAGAAGQAVAKLLGSEPKQQLEQDLPRMKSLIERGALVRPAAHGTGAESRVLH